jgi:hypothetical protein
MRLNVVNKVAQKVWRPFLQSAVVVRVALARQSHPLVLFSRSCKGCELDPRATGKPGSHHGRDTP